MSLMHPTISALAAAAGYFLAQGFAFPAEYGYFQFLAVLGTLAGYGLSLAATWLRTNIAAAMTTVAAILVVGAAATVAYGIRSKIGGAIELSILLAGAFACLGFLIGFVTAAKA
jgi:hypothetical protein